MKTFYTLITALLIATTTFAQNGINYKAIVKDGSGNVIANDLIQVQFSILQGAVQTNVYSETHAPTTDANGLVILNIGEGALLSGDFTTVDWGSDDHFLNVQINTGGGFVDLGTTQFKTVPYALKSDKATSAETATIALNVSGLEKINEGNGNGWRLIGSDPLGYGDIGSGAVDFSGQASGSGGALGNGSFALGIETRAQGSNSIVNGFSSESFGDNSLAMGTYAFASGSHSFSFGEETSASGNYSTAMGFFTKADAFASFGIGRYNIGGGNSTTWIDTDPLFEIGNGISSGNRSNVLTVLKNGTITAPSFDLSEITDAKALVTKEYVEANVGTHDHLGETWTGTAGESLTINGGTTNAGAAALNISNSGSRGIQIFPVGESAISISSPGRDGVFISNPGFDGVSIFNPANDGIEINSAGDNGVEVNSATDNGGFFKGTTSGIHAESSNNANPDIILGGTANSATGDDGIIASDPQYAGSDIFLRSNDAVVIQLDVDDNEGTFGQFEVKDNAGTVLFDVHDDGRVGIGTTSPVSTLHINHSNSLATGGLSISNANVSEDEWKLFTSIGSPLFLLFNNITKGSFSAGSGAYTTFSDRNLKNNITPITSILDKVKTLDVVSYKFNDQTDNTKYIGLIAQDVEKVFPHLVVKPNPSEAENSHYTMDYSGFGVLAIKAIQEQQDKIQSLEKNVEVLMKRLEALENK